MHDPTRCVSRRSPWLNFYLPTREGSIAAGNDFETIFLCGRNMSSFPSDDIYDSCDTIKFPSSLLVFYIFLERSEQILNNIVFVGMEGCSLVLLIYWVSVLSEWNIS